MYDFTDPRARGRRSGRDDLGFGVGPAGPFRSRLEAGLHRYSNPGEDDPKRPGDADNRTGLTARSDTADYTAQTGFTGTAKPKDADEAIKGFMMDERYWKPNHPQRDAYRDAVAALWKRAYPGTYTPGPFGRGVKPSATADEILGLAKSILPRQAPPTGIGRNSGSVGLPDAVAVSLKDMPPEERSGPAPKPPGIQVAHEDSGNGLVTIPGQTLTGLGVDPNAVKDLGDKKSTAYSATPGTRRKTRHCWASAATAR